MDNLNLNKHISGQFNAELEYIRTQVMTMGGLVEQQLSDAITAMHNQDSATENMLKLVPDSLREAAYALGTPKWKMISAITLKASVSGIMTGILLAIARIAGETAPLLFTALSNQFWSTDMMQPIANLPVTIFKFAMSPFAEWQQLAWAGVLIITLCVLLLNILARVIFAKKKHG